MASNPEIAPPIPVPVLTPEKFAELTGLTRDTIRGMVDRGYLPTRLIGRRRLINVVQLHIECQSN